MSFYPEGVEISTGNNYLKFKPGETRFRILTEPVIGFEWWVQSKPKRTTAVVKDGRFVPSTVINISEITRQQDMPKLFNTFIVWDYQTNQTAILEVTQKTILKFLMEHDRDVDWGDFREYDIVVKRIGTTKEDTEYSAIAKPKKEITEDVKDAFKNTKIDLKVWLNGGDPLKESTKLEDQIPETVEDLSNGIPF